MNWPLCVRHHPIDDKPFMVIWPADYPELPAPEGETTAVVKRSGSVKSAGR